MFRTIGAAAVLGAALFASSAFAQHRGGGGHGGGGHGGGGHGGGGHASGHGGFHAPSHGSSHGMAPAHTFHSPAVHGTVRSPTVHSFAPHSNFSSRVPTVSTHPNWNNTWRNGTWNRNNWNRNNWNGNAWNFRRHDGFFHNRSFFWPFFGYYPWPFGFYGYPLYAGYNYYNPGYYSPGYDDYFGSGYYGDYYGDMTAPDYTPMYPVDQQPQDYSRAAVAAMANIEVILPDPNAQVWFNGVLTRVTGERRSFASPPLTPGSTYTYEVRASWNQDGRTMSASRSIQVSAGMNRTVDFRQAPATIQDRIIPRP